MYSGGAEDARLCTEGRLLKKDHGEETFQGLILREESVADKYFSHCTFRDCIIEDCELLDCRFFECRFERCRISGTQLRNVQCVSADFERCSLSGIQWAALQPPRMRFALPFRTLRGCQLRYNTFMDIRLDRFDFSDCSIVGSMFSQCSLVEADLRRCSLEETEFFRCDLSKADMREATGYQVDIMTCRLKDARFSFPEVMGLLNGLGIKVD